MANDVYFKVYSCLDKKLNQDSSDGKEKSENPKNNGN